MAKLLDGFNNLSPKSRASFKASFWELDPGQELVTTIGPDGEDWTNKKFTIVGNGEEDAEGNVQLAPAGICLSGSSLTTGDRSDTFVGVGEFVGVGLTNFTLKTGKGNDTVNGEGGNAGGNTGVVLFDNSRIIMGVGNDSINGQGGFGGVGLFGDSGIDMGGGDDVIIGEGGIYVYDDSEINMGSGNDTVDALVGGFVGSGVTEGVDEDGFPTVTFTGGFINFDEGDDTLIGGGFGSGITFDGGVGEDKVVLGDGTYTYGDDDDGFGPYLSDGLDRMSIVDFELISGTAGIAEDGSGLNATSDGSQALVPLGEYTIQNGHLIV